MTLKFRKVPECPHCHSTSVKMVHEGYHYNNFRGEQRRTPYKLYTCSNCGNNHEREGHSELDPEMVDGNLF
jgi:ribosomal protein L37AE/L43A